MNRVPLAMVTKVRQRRASTPVHKPGRPYNGPNYVAQKAESAKKSARKNTKARKAIPQA